MIRDAEESRLGQFRPITCQIATSDPRVPYLCCQGIGHAFKNALEYVHRFCKLFSTRSIELLYSVRVFDKVHFFLQVRVFISPCVFSTRSIVRPGVCSVQSAWFYGKFCFINFCSEAGGTTLIHSGLILLLRAVGNRCKMTFLLAAPTWMMVCAVPSVWKKCQNRNRCLLFAKFDPIWSQIDPLWSKINPLWSQSQP